MNHWNGVSESVPSFTTSRLGNVLWSLFRYSLVHTVFSHVFFFFFFMRLLKAKLEKRPGHLLITYSSFLLL